MRVRLATLLSCTQAQARRVASGSSLRQPPRGRVVQKAEGFKSSPAIPSTGAARNAIQGVGWSTDLALPAESDVYLSSSREVSRANDFGEGKSQSAKSAPMGEPGSSLL
jgi:hypothetical protein